MENKFLKTNNVIRPIITSDGRRLIPKSEYKGPILKLTTEDNRKISCLQNEIANYELQLIKILEILSGKMNARERDYYSGVAFNLESVIKGLKNDIRKIKIFRINQQKQENNL